MSVEHHEFKRQISSHESLPCFLLDGGQSPFQRSTNIATPFSPPSSTTTMIQSPNVKSPKSNRQQQYRLFASPHIPSATSSITPNHPRTRSLQTADSKTCLPLKNMSDIFPDFDYSKMTALDSIMNNETRSFDCTTATTANNNNYNINGSQLNTPTTTVTIFGFRENDVESIQNYFSNIGQIDSISREDDTNDTNYLNITYKNLVSFQNALNLSGILLDGCIIGVVPFKET